jgi:hypothetical protein
MLAAALTRHSGPSPPRQVGPPYCGQLLADDPHLCGAAGGVADLYRLEALVDADPPRTVVDEQQRRDQRVGNLVELPMARATQWRVNGTRGR